MQQFYCYSIRRFRAHCPCCLAIRHSSALQLLWLVTIEDFYCHYYHGAELSTPIALVRT
jgi:hypothetical protein